jgi:hypothetical protein
VRFDHVGDVESYAAGRGWKETIGARDENQHDEEKTGRMDGSNEK